MMDRIEKTIMTERTVDLKRIRPRELFGIVQCYAQLQRKSDLIYLLEPHVLVNLKAFSASQLALLCNFYFRLEKGSVDFLKQLATMACISASQSSLSTTLSMYKSLRLITDFRPHLRVILD